MSYPVSDKDAALSIARRIAELLAPPVDDYQRELIFEDLRKRFCLHCGAELSEVRHCYCMNVSEPEITPVSPPPDPA